FFFFQAEDGIRDRNVTGVQTCALPVPCFAICSASTPSTALLDSALYAVMPPATAADAPDTSIKVAQSRPPVSDSATATVWPASIRARTRPVAVVISHCAGSPVRRAHTQIRFRP